MSCTIILRINQGQKASIPEGFVEVEIDKHCDISPPLETRLGTRCLLYFYSIKVKKIVYLFMRLKYRWGVVREGVILQMSVSRQFGQ